MKEFFKKIFADESERIITWKIWFILLFCFLIPILIEIIFNEHIMILYETFVELPIMHIVQISISMQVFYKPLLGVLIMFILLKRYGERARFKNFTICLFLYLMGIFLSHIIVWFFIHPSTITDDLLDTPWFLTHLWGIIVFTILGLIPNKGRYKLFGKMWVIHFTYYIVYFLYIFSQIIVGKDFIIPLL